MKKRFFIVIVTALLIMAGAMCWTAPSAQAGTSDVTIAWDHSVDLPYIDGYRIYYGTESGKYGAPIFVGKVSQYTVSGLADGTYYFVLTAIDPRGLESVPTPEVSCTLKTLFLPPTNVKLTIQLSGSVIISGTLTTNQTNQ